MIDRARYGGNNLNIKDENCPPYTPFYLFISGHIESGQINEYDGICCKYDFMTGTDWSIIDVRIHFVIEFNRVIKVEYHNTVIRVNKLIEEQFGTILLSYNLGHIMLADGHSQC